MATVTVPGGGPGSAPLTFTITSGAGLTVAQQIANALAASGTLSVTSSSAGGAIASPTVGAGVTTELILTGTNPTTVPSGFNFAVNNATSPTTITASAGVQLLTGTVGGTFFATGAGAAVGAVGGNNTITATGSGETIGGGVGSNMLLATAATGGVLVQSNGNDTITLSNTSGVDTVTPNSTIGGGSVFVQGGSGAMIVAGGTPESETVISGTGATSIWGSSSTGLYALNGSTNLFGNLGGADTIIGGSGTSTIFGGTGSDLVFAGSGGLIYSAAAETGPATVVGGPTQVTLFGGANVNLNFINSSPTQTGGALFAAGSGNETLNAAGASSKVIAFGSGGKDVLIGGSAADTLVAGSGGTTMAGGAGANFFDVVAGRSGGAITIADMNTSDTLLITAPSSSPLSAAAIAADNTAIAAATGNSFTLSDGTTITFQNVTVASVLSSIKVG